MKHYFVSIILFLIPQVALTAQGQEKTYEKWRIGITGGAGYITAGTGLTLDALEMSGVERSKAKKGLDDLRIQLHLGADAHYLIKPNWGVGVKYLFSHSNGTIKDIDLNYNGDGITYVVGNIESDYFINYIGPSFMAQSFIGNSKKLAVTSIASLGYSRLRVEQVSFNSPAVMTGSAFGAFVSCGIAYSLTQKLSLGCDLGFFSSSFGSVTYKDRYATWKTKLDKREKENVSNLNLALSLRMNI